MSDSQRYPLNLSSINDMENIVVVLGIKVFISNNYYLIIIIPVVEKQKSEPGQLKIINF